MSKESDWTPRFPTVAAMVVSQAQDRGDAIAITAGQHRASYQQMADRSARTAAFLIQLGVQPEDRIVHIGKASLVLFDLFFATARLGVSFVSLNFRLSSAEIAFQIGDCGADHVFYESGFGTLLADLASPHLQCHVIDDGSFEAQTAAAVPVDLPAVQPDAELMMMYTSGTTGRAKGVRVTHLSYMVSRSADGLMGDWSLYEEGERMMVATPLFHIAGIGWALIGYYNGQQLILEPDFIPDVICRSLVENRVARVLFVPVMLSFLLEALKDSPLTFPDLKLIAYGASPISTPLLCAAMDRFNCGFLQVYGMTETNGCACYLPPEDHEDRTAPRFTSAGKPYPFLDIEIRDRDGRALKAGETGEICIKTPTAMMEYLNRDEETASVLDQGWYKSGDGGYRDHDGYIYVRDRIKDMIISGGENVYPTEVEAAIMATGLVKECAIVSAKEPAWGEVIVLAAVPVADLTLDQVRHALRGRLADYKCPRRLMIYDALPRNASGKVLRATLRDTARAYGKPYKASWC